MPMNYVPREYTQRGPGVLENMAQAFGNSFVPSYVNSLQKKLEEHHENEKQKQMYDELGDFTDVLEKPNVTENDLLREGRSRNLSPNALRTALGLHQQNTQNKIAQQRVQATNNFNRNVVNQQDTAIISDVLSRKPNAKAKDFVEAGATISGINSWKSANKTSAEDSQERLVRKEINKEIKDMNLDDEEAEFIKLKVDENVDKGLKPFKAVDAAKREFADREKNKRVIRTMAQDADVPGLFGGSKESKITKLQSKFKNLSESQKELALPTLLEKGWTQEEAVRILAPEKDAEIKSLKQQLLDEAGGDVNRARELAKQRGIKVTG